MTINELFVYVLERVFGLLERIVLAFARTFSLVGEGRLGQLVLSDLAIVAVVGGFGLCVLYAMFVEPLLNWLSGRAADLDEDLDEDPRNDP